MMDDVGYEGDTPQHIGTKRFAVCPRCEGRRTHVNPAIDGNGITSEEMDELGPDFFEDYMGGVYDVRCERCNGEGLVPRCTQTECQHAVEQGTWVPLEEQSDEPGLSVMVDRLYAHCWEHFIPDEKEAYTDEMNYRAEIEAERRMGA